MQIIVAARKAESKTEKTQEKVRARAMVTSDLGEGMAELSQQIAKLMAALTQTGQGPSPSSVPDSSWEHGYRWKCGGRSTPVTQTPTMAGAALARQPQPTAYPWSMGHREPGWRSVQLQAQCKGEGHSWMLRPTLSPVFLDVRDGAMWLGNALSQHWL